MNLVSKLALAVSLSCPALLTAQGTAAASVVTIGSTTCGTIALTTNGGLPTIPNAAFELQLTGGVPAAGEIVVLVLGLPSQPVITTPPPFLACDYYPGAATVDFLLGLLDGSGELTQPLPIPNDPGAAGLSFVVQILSVPLLTSTPDEIGFSNGLQITVGN